MEVPAGFRDPHRPNLVCRLLKALYGLKQAPRRWYAKIHEFLTKVLKFENCPYELCLYTFRQGPVFLCIILYVDDLLIAGNNGAESLRVKKELSSHFKMKNLGTAKEFLGIQITRDRAKRTLFLTQSTFVDKILERFHMTDAKSVATPMEVPSSNSFHPDPEPLSDNTLYRSAIGSLMYLMLCTRPDIAFAVGKLSQYCENPSSSHWKAVKRVYRYIKGTKDMGIQFGPSTSSIIIGYSDSDWAGCTESRKSTEAYVFMMTGGAISWRSKKQSIVALSSCEAEYISLCTAAKEAIWLSKVLCSLLGDNHPTPIPIRVDNQGSISSAQNMSIKSRNKHIDIRHHFVRQAVDTRQITLSYCPSDDQTADVLTKPLLRVLFEKMRNSLGIALRSNHSLKFEGAC